MSANGAWKVPAKHVAGESSGGDDGVYIHHSLQHFNLASVTGPGNVKFYGDTDEMISEFKERQQ